jgi:RIO-like serine/threonine protein kinase
MRPVEQLAPYLHDHQLRVLHALETASDGTGLVTVGRLPRITGLSIEKIRRTLHLFEVLRVIWWETPDVVRLRRRHRPWANRSTPCSALSPRSPWLEAQQ